MFMTRLALFCTAIFTLSACIPPPQVDMSGTLITPVGGIVLEDFTAPDTSDSSTTKVSSTTLEYMGTKRKTALFRRNYHTQLTTPNRPGGMASFTVKNSSKTSQPNIISIDSASEISGDISGTSVINKQSINFFVDLTLQDKSIIINNSKVLIISADATRLVYKVVEK